MAYGVTLLNNSYRPSPILSYMDSDLQLACLVLLFSYVQCRVYMCMWCVCVCVRACVRACELACVCVLSNCVASVGIVKPATGLWLPFVKVIGKA